MSKYFVTDPPVAVLEYDDQTTGNVIWIKPKMDVETRGRVRSELAQLGEDGKTPIMQAGAEQTALLLHNIVRWAGPDLDSTPCTPANIRRIDPTEPHIEKVLNQIGERNKKQASPNPKSPAGSGFLSDGNLALNQPAPAESIAHQLATTTVTSPLRSALDGRLSKSAD
jgi:hypothetical protein